MYACINSKPQGLEEKPRLASSETKCIRDFLRSSPHFPPSRAPTTSAACQPGTFREDSNNEHHNNTNTNTNTTTTTTTNTKYNIDTNTNTNTTTTTTTTNTTTNIYNANNNNNNNAGRSEEATTATRGEEDCLVTSMDIQ